MKRNPYILPVQHYTVRENSRAKRVILRVHPHGRLEVVIPAGFDRNRVPEIVRSHAEWIRHTLERMKSRTGGLPDGPLSLPDMIYLRAVNLHFPVRFIQARDGTVKLTQTGDHRLELVGNRDEIGACIELLGLWLRRQGRLHLIPRLQAVAEEVGLSFKKARVLHQKSRWGSCSGKGTISLNQDLLFLPPELVRYILIHELCHTLHLNHSREFWARVAVHEPDFKSLDAQVNRAREFVPQWAGKF